MGYKLINNIAGWAAFLFALIVYILTVEPTASFWDCGEFIATSYKLEVPHPPGAPFFLLTGRMFSLLASDVSQVAYWVNMLSVLSSAFTVLFLFWTITHLARKILGIQEGEASTGQIIAVIGAGAVGSLAFTFSDSFWFSAVEAEVYAMSSFFTAFVFWAILKWENLTDEADRNKWIILIAYMMGLSIGVHLLNLVTIPALGLIYYFRQYKPTLWGVIGTLVVSGLLVILINNIIIPGLPTVAGAFEINFVNELGLPFGSGIVVFLGLLIAFIVYSIISTASKEKLSDVFVLVMVIAVQCLIGFIVYSGAPLLTLIFVTVVVLGIYFGTGKNIHKTAIIAGLGIVPGVIVWYTLFEGNNKRERYVETIDVSKLNTFLLSLAFILIGYSSYTVVLIRSNYNTPIDENNPEDIIQYVSYLKREQYGNRPLFKGQYFTAKQVSQKKGAPVYEKGEDKYVVKDYKVEVEYEEDHTTILPRMYSKSADGGHQRRYREITGLRENEKPSFADNIYFMIRHQLGHMYFRYFMWNFSGRESDIQDAKHLTVLDSFDVVPEELADNKARNIYFSLPLLFGLFGMFIQFIRNPKYFGVTALLFVLTGIALVLYLNSPPVEPRERDYIYTGSYYVFAIWIGFGVLALFDWIKNLTKEAKISAALATVICMTIPTIMGMENWDDHDRSARYFSVDAAKNYLDSCAPNAILFTGGDNDTFPLWYVQEVEGHRTDVRVIVLSYFNTDWYIEQMMRPAYESEPLPFGLTLDHYKQGGLNDYLPVVEDPRIKGAAINARLYLDLVNKESPNLQVPTSVSAYNAVPSKLMFMNIDSSKFAGGELSAMPTELGSDISQHLTDRLVWNVKGQGLEKKDLAIIDLIVNNDWERPIYFNTTSIRGINMELRQHVVQEGLTYRLMPIEYRSPTGEYLINTEVMYDNLMNKFNFRGLNDPTAYNSEYYLNFCLNHRSAFNSLAQALIDKGETEKAREVLKKCLEVMPNSTVPYDFFSVQQVGMLFEIGENELALDIAEKYGDRAEEYLEYARSEAAFGDAFEQRRRLIALQEIAFSLQKNSESQLASKYANVVKQYEGG